jgi:pimeloyl-ACP methyl ester carboxylesterase
MQTLNAFVIAIAALLVPVIATAAPADVGIVLLHGKWGSPAGMQRLANQLEEKGYSVVTPEMAWSGKRLYDIDYPAALREIGAHVVDLRAKGAKRVIVAGQSLGANAAAAYAFSGMDLDGLVLFSPGHFPEKGFGGPPMRASLSEARQMVASKRGGETSLFNDINQGKRRSLQMSAAIYLSYFDPNGLGAMTRTIRKLPKPVPVLLAIGTQDPFFGESRAFFDSAPAHPQSRYAALQGDHFAVPDLVAEEFLRWLEIFSR